MTRRAARQGDPEPHHQVSLLGPATPSRRLTQRVQTGTPVAGGGRPPPLQAAIGKQSLALTLDPQPLKGAAASGTGPEAAGCLSPGGAHQENSREQKFASCNGLGFSSRDTGCILPAWTSAGRGRGVGAAPGHTQV